MKAYTHDPKNWPPTFSRLWLWTMGAAAAVTPKVLDLAKAIGVTDVASLLNNSPDHPIAHGAAELGRAVKGAGLGWHPGIWIATNADGVLAQADALYQLAHLTKADSVIFDAEGEWRHRLKNPTQYVAGVVSPAFANFKVPIGITSFAVLPREVAPLVAWAVQYHHGYGQPQAYSVDQGKAWQRAASVQPDTIVDTANKSWRGLCPRLVPLVAAYGGVHQGWTPSTALEANLLRAAHAGNTEVGLWSAQALYRSGLTARHRREVLAELQITRSSSIVAPPVTPWKGIMTGGLTLAAAAAAGLTAAKLIKGVS